MDNKLLQGRTRAATAGSASLPAAVAGALQLTPEQSLPEANRHAMLSIASSMLAQDSMSRVRQDLHATHLVHVSTLQRSCCICWCAYHMSACTDAAIISCSCVLLLRLQLLLRCLMVLWRLLGIRVCCLLLA